MEIYVSALTWLLRACIVVWSRICWILSWISCKCWRLSSNEKQHAIRKSYKTLTATYLQLTLQCGEASILPMHSAVFIHLQHESFGDIVFPFASFCRYSNALNVQVKAFVLTRLLHSLCNTDICYKFFWTPHISILHSQLLCFDLLEEMHNTNIEITNIRIGLFSIVRFNFIPATDTVYRPACGSIRK